MSKNKFSIYSMPLTNEESIEYKQLALKKADDLRKKEENRKKLMMQSYIPDMTEPDEYDSDGNIVDKETSDDEYEVPPTFKVRIEKCKITFSNHPNCTNDLITDLINISEELLKESNSMEEKWVNSRNKLNDQELRLTGLTEQVKQFENQIKKLKNKQSESSNEKETIIDITKLVIKTQLELPTESAARSGVQYDDTYNNNYYYNNPGRGGGRTRGGVDFEYRGRPRGRGRGGGPR